MFWLSSMFLWRIFFQFHFLFSLLKFCFKSPSSLEFFYYLDLFRLGLLRKSFISENWFLKIKKFFVYIFCGFSCIKKIIKIIFPWKNLKINSIEHFSFTLKACWHFLPLFSMSSICLFWKYFEYSFENFFWNFFSKNVLIR